MQPRELDFKHTQAEPSARVDKPSLSPRAPRTLSSSQLESFGSTLPPDVKDVLNNTYGKPTIDISFCGEYRLRHAIPFVFNSGFLCRKDLTNWGLAHKLVNTYSDLMKEYGAIDPAPLRGYDMHRNFADENTLNLDRIRLATAALLRCQMNVPRLVRYLAGPHLATHRDVKKILARLRLGVDPDVLREVKRVFTTGPPTKCYGSSTEQNFWEYYKYGNHSSASSDPEELMKVLIKDSKRGNAILVDPRAALFVRDSHFTPLGIADKENPYKKSRQIFDASFRPSIHSFAINDWTNKVNEPPVTFPGSFLRLLVWTWNLRISFPWKKLLIMDNDITNAFRLLKLNPEVVPMHAYQACGYVGFATGQSFGGCFCPPNFDPVARARIQQARYLWKHEPKETLERAASYVANMKLPLELVPDEYHTVAQANFDSLNTGVYEDCEQFRPGDIRVRLPPAMPMQVDDLFSTDIRDTMPLTSAASIVALEDTFGPDHPCQEMVLSQEKLDLEYGETRLLVGFVLETRRMVVKLSPRRREKILKMILEQKWLHAGKRATIREIASLIGLLGDAAMYFPWAKAQLLVLTDLLRMCIRRGYHRAKAILSRRPSTTPPHFSTWPKTIQDRFHWQYDKDLAEFIWRNRETVPVCEQCGHAIHVVYKYLLQQQPWETPIGHIVPRDFAFEGCTTDASRYGIGAQIPRLKVWCMIPFAPSLVRRAFLPSSHPEYIHINVLEYLGILVCFIVIDTHYALHPEEFPPFPTMRSLCDNTSAITWWNKTSTESLLGRNAIKLSAEFQLRSAIGTTIEFIKGTENVVADTISRPHELFTPIDKNFAKFSYGHLAKQVSKHQKHLGSWRVFLPSAELLSSLGSTLSCDWRTERPSIPKKLGRFAPAASISSGGVLATGRSSPYFLE